MNNQYRVVLNSNFIETTCRPQCPLECESLVFPAFISSFDTIGNLYYDFINENQNLTSDFVYTNLTIEKAKDSFSFFLLYYTHNSYTESIEVPSMTLVSLFSSLGGSVGVCLGASLIHLCELFQVLIEIVYVKLIISRTRSKSVKAILVLNNKNIRVRRGAVAYEVSEFYNF